MEQSISISIIVGIVSGIITSFLISLVVIFFRTVAIPWFQSTFYLGIKISGLWLGFNSTNAARTDPDCHIAINQKGHKITGEILMIRNLSGNQDMKALDIKGIFKDGNLILTYTPKDQRRLGSGTYVMKLTNDGRNFEGKCLFIASNNGGNVGEEAEFWKRKED